MYLLVQLGQKGGVKMNFAEKYNSIITFIEENLHRKTDEISQIMAGELKIFVFESLMYFYCSVT